LRIAAVRDLDIIDSELRLLAAVRWACREQDGLLDERSERTGDCAVPAL
jgi:hypothetical protein